MRPVHIDHERWQIWRHVVYGWRFRQKWEDDEKSKREEPNMDTDVFDMHDIDVALDDHSIVLLKRI